MDKTVFVALLFAIVCPFVWALMNILDKFVVENRIRKPLSFAIVAGLVNLVFGIILAIFLDWSGLNSISQLIYPAVAGIIFGAQFFLYYYLISKEDVSNVIGLIYAYPLLVVILSFFLLDEVFSLFAYLGIFLIIVGAVVISTNMRNLKKDNQLWAVFLIIFVVAIYEFLIKVSTTNLPEINGIAIIMIFIGVTIMFGFFHKTTRRGVKEEIKHYKWAILTESLTFLGILTTFYAMSGLPASIVSTLAATQPLFVLFLEKIFHKRGIRIAKDERLLPKLIPLLLIVIGLILLSIFHQF